MTSGKTKTKTIFCNYSRMHVQLLQHHANEQNKLTRPLDYGPVVGWVRGGFTVACF